MNQRISTPQDAQLALLRAENSRLKIALKPFADAGDEWGYLRLDDGQDRTEELLRDVSVGGPAEQNITIGHLIDARGVLDQCM